MINSGGDERNRKERPGKMKVFNNVPYFTFEPDQINKTHETHEIDETDQTDQIDEIDQINLFLCF
ncbi:MAG: hypothetical protein J7J52_06740 [Deltaproteobacteria bacterium]|nr:hypothetical protein [Deltaproteobacteria bacterium]